MALVSKLAAVVNGLVTNIDISASDLVTSSVYVGGGSGTQLTKAVLDSLIANSHAPMSDNQNIVAGSGLTGGGSGATVNLSVDTTVVRTNGANAFSADQSMGGNKLTNVATPVSGTDASNKNYVDNAINGLSWKSYARLATAAALPANTYNNGSSGVGATLTANANGALSVDGVAVATNDRILVKDEATSANNGLYIVTNAGSAGAAYVLTRTTDANTAAELVAAACWVDEGTANASSGWVQSTIAPITVGTTALVFNKFSATAAAYVFRNGLNLSGTNVDVVPGDSSLSATPGSLVVVEDPAGAIVTGGSGIKVQLEASNPSLQIVSNALGAKLDGAGAIISGASGLKVQLESSNPSLQIVSNKLGAKLDAAGAILSGAGGLAVQVSSTGGIQILSNALALKLADASLATSASGVSVQEDPAGAISTGGSGIKVNVDNSSIEIASNALRIKTTAYDQLTITGGGGSAAAVQYSPQVAASYVAGEAFAANTSFLVRWAVSGETAGRVYKADKANAATDLKFWAFGVALSTSSVSAGQSIQVVAMGTSTLGSSDTNFSSGDVGKAIWLTSAGAFSTTSPSSSGDASYKIGTVQAVNKMYVDSKQLTGIN